MKLVPFLLAGLLALAAAGRFHAEAQVRQVERQLSQLSRDKQKVEGEIERVRLEVEVLESAGRLSELNANHLALRAVRAEQLVDDQAVAQVIGLMAPHKPAALPANADIIGNAIGMIDPALGAVKGRE